MAALLAWKPRAWIPNVAGTWVEVLMRDGSTCVVQVVRGASGLHELDGIAITDVVGWRGVS